MIPAKAFHGFALPLSILIVLAFLPAVTFGQIPNSAGDRPGTSQPGDSPSPPPGETQRTQHDSAQASPTCGITHPGQCLKDIGHDQVGIWTSPLRINQPRFWEGGLLRPPSTVGGLTLASSPLLCRCCGALAKVLAHFVDLERRLGRVDLDLFA